MQTVKYVKTTAERYTGVETSLLGFPVKEVNAGDHWVGTIALPDGSTVSIRIGQFLVSNELGSVEVRPFEYVQKMAMLEDICHQACGVEVPKKESEGTDNFFGVDAIKVIESINEETDKFLKGFRAHQAELANQQEPTE
jgi:hypothetical protein